MGKKVAVICPVYNTEEYLSECLDSIINQTLNQCDIEVIIVNDGSTDNSAKIIKKYKKKYPDWVVIEQENQGLAAARNRGLQEVTAEFFCYLDTDDYYIPESFEKMYENAIDTKVDMVISKIKAFDANNEYGYYSDSVLSTKRVVSYHEDNSIIKAISVCSKLYKTETLGKYRFLNIRYHEDNYYSIIAMYNANLVSILPEQLYCRRYREGENLSLMQSLNYESFIDMNVNYQQILKEVPIYEKHILMFCLKNSIRYIKKHVKGIKKQTVALNKTIRLIKIADNTWDIGIPRKSYFIIYSWLYYIYASFGIILYSVIKFNRGVSR